MYETHFGLTAAPFGLNPDPAFFFGSKGHSHALSYLKFGVYQGEGFVVVTGDIGAGKTTLVATLLSGLDKEQIVCAQIVSTQLEAGDLLRSVALAFGVAPKSLSKAELIATIEAFLTLLVTQKRRALLIVDEAQNLSREAVEELRMLSNFQLGNKALLQSFLVGQPELRELLTSKPMEQLRQRVIASCHLGPMDRTETQAYIEHRLRQAGWHGNPAFQPDTFERIFQWTGGIPRRVNLLCNRLLLGAYLAEQSSIDGDAVDVIANDAREEVSSSRPTIGAPTSRAGAKPSSVASPSFPAAPRLPETSVPRTGVPPTPSSHASSTSIAHTPSRPPLLVVATNPTEDLKVAVLTHALQAQGGDTATVRVRVGEPTRFAHNDELLGQLGILAPTLTLDACEAPGSEQVADVLRRFTALIDEQRPETVVVTGNSDAAFACALASSKRGCRVVHVDAGRRGTAALPEDRLNGLLTDRMAQAFFPSSNAAYVALIREGVDEAFVGAAADLMTDVMRLALCHLPPPQEVAQRRLARPGLERFQRRYGWVSVEAALLYSDREAASAILSSIAAVAAESALLWPMSRAVSERLLVMGLRETIPQEAITIVEPLGFLDSLSLMTGATVVIADSRDVKVQAALIGVRCVVIGPNHPADPGPIVQDAQSEGAARAIAAHLVRILAAERLQTGA